MLIIVGTAKLLTSLDTGVVIILLYFSSDNIFCRMGLSTFGICTCLKLIQSNITLKTVVVKTTKLAMLVGAAFGHPVLSKVLIRKLVRIIFSVLKNRRSFMLITPAKQKEMYAADNMSAA